MTDRIEAIVSEAQLKAAAATADMDAALFAQQRAGLLAEGYDEATADAMLDQVRARLACQDAIRGAKLREFVAEALERENPDG